MGNGLQGKWGGGNQARGGGREAGDSGRSYSGGGEGQKRSEARDDDGAGGGKRQPQGYRDLFAWQKALELAVVVQGLLARFPAEERGGLGADLLRAATGVPARIAAGKQGDAAEFGRALGEARCLVAELDTLLIVAVELGYLKAADLAQPEELMGSVRALTTRLMQRLRDGPKSQGQRDR